ncbi:MAG: 5'-nucleotidase C-terminal domain-containing protein [Vulcanimicrobiota bacterium]
MRIDGIPQSTPSALPSLPPLPLPDTEQKEDDSFVKSSGKDEQKQSPLPSCDSSESAAASTRTEVTASVAAEERPASSEPAEAPVSSTPAEIAASDDAAETACSSTPAPAAKTGETAEAEISPSTAEISHLILTRAALAAYGAAAALRVSSAGAPTAAAAGLATIDIIYTNDIHGAISPKGDDKEGLTGGVAYMGTLIRKLQSESKDNFLLLDGGDWGQGSYESKLTHGNTLIDVMNNLEYDAAEVGNHEFDWGRSALSDMIKNAEFPIVGANILEKGQLMDGVKPYTLEEVNGLKVGVIGLISQETPGATDPKNIGGLTFESTSKTVKTYIPELKEKGADLIVVLSHQGDKADENLARAVSGIDVIVGGHSHTEIPEPRLVNNTIIVQSGTGGAFVGDLTIDVDRETKKVSTYRNRLLPVNSKELTPDPAIEKIIAPVVQEAQEVMGKTLGRSDVDLTHNRKKVFETVLGNVITDGMRETAESDIAMTNSGAIRDQLMKGDLDFGDLYRVLPFDKNIVTIGLTGTEIKEILENSADRKKGNLQVSGLTMDIEPRNSKGSKVSEIMVQGEPLEEKKLYRVTIDDFLAGGANGYLTFLNGREPIYGGLVVETLKSYVEKHSPLTQDIARIEGRLNFLSPPS